MTTLRLIRIDIAASTAIMLDPKAATVFERAGDVNTDQRYRMGMFYDR